jgi:hypothetical protein
MRPAGPALKVRPVIAGQSFSVISSCRGSGRGGSYGPEPSGAGAPAARYRILQQPPEPGTPYEFDLS